jgi:hypothetical protein
MAGARHLDPTELAPTSIVLQTKPIKTMKLLRLLPFCLSIAALPLVLTGCNRSADDTSSTAGDTNAAPAADTNTTSTTTTTTTDTNAAPAPAPTTDTNAPATDTNTPPMTNTSTSTTNASGM